MNNTFRTRRYFSVVLKLREYKIFYTLLKELLVYTHLLRDVLQNIDLPEEDDAERKSFCKI